MSSQQPTDEMILAYAADELDAEQRACVEAHLAESPAAARMVALYRAARERLRADDSEKPPRHVLEQAKAICRSQRPEAAPRWLEWVDALIARLVFDSRVQPVGVRHAQSPLRVQLSFEYESIRVDIQAERQRSVDEGDESGGQWRGEPRWRVMGQLAGERPLAGVPVRFVNSESGHTISETSTDAREMFQLDIVPGRYDLCAQLPSGLLVMPQIELD